MRNRVLIIPFLFNQVYLDGRNHLRDEICLAMGGKNQFYFIRKVELVCEADFIFASARISLYNRY